MVLACERDVYCDTLRGVIESVYDRASDLKADLLTIVLEYAGTFEDNALDRACYGDSLDDMLLRRRVDQEGCEAGQLRGDWR